MMEYKEFYKLFSAGGIAASISARYGWIEAVNKAVPGGLTNKEIVRLIERWRSPKTVGLTLIEERFVYGCVPGGWRVASTKDLQSKGWTRLDILDFIDRHRRAPVADTSEIDTGVPRTLTLFDGQLQSDLFAEACTVDSRMRVSWDMRTPGDSPRDITIYYESLPSATFAVCVEAIHGTKRPSRSLLTLSPSTFAERWLGHENASFEAIRWVLKGVHQIETILAHVWRAPEVQTVLRELAPVFLEEIIDTVDFRRNVVDLFGFPPPGRRTQRHVSLPAPGSQEGERFVATVFATGAAGFRDAR